MSRFWMLITVAAVALCLPPAMRSGAAGGKAARMDAKALAPLTRPAALFDHDAHNKKAQLDDRCWVCHHTDGKKLAAENSSEGQACADCHPVKAEKGKTALRQAYHGQCQSCHAAQKAGPLACAACHKSGE